MSRPTEPTWGKVPHALLNLEDAQDRIAAEVIPPASETIPFDHATGRVLAAPIVAGEDHPAFNKAMMDGYAVRASDCSQPTAELEIIGLAAAGSQTTQRLGPHQAMQINTGAAVPDGADAVVRIEDTTLFDSGPQSDRRVRINTAVKAGQHVAERGSNVRQGQTILAPPVRLGPAQLAAAATAGAANVEVYPRVSAAIVVTGDELVAVAAPKRPGQIFESNGPMLAAMLRQFGAEPNQIGIVPDKPGPLKRQLAKALKYPLVVTVGGMSMGTLDLVPQVFAELGVAWRFHGVRVRPGKPVAYGRGPKGQHCFGLPGNPVSAFVCAWLFVRMVVRGLEGLGPCPPVCWTATLTEDLKAGRDSRPAVVPARVWNSEDHGMMAEPCDWHGSGDPFGLARANALLIRRQPTEAAAAGSRVEVILIAEND